MDAPDPTQANPHHSNPEDPWAAETLVDIDNVTSSADKVPLSGIVMLAALQEPGYRVPERLGIDNVVAIDPTPTELVAPTEGMKRAYAVPPHTAMTASTRAIPLNRRVKRNRRELLVECCSSLVGSDSALSCNGWLRS